MSRPDPPIHVVAIAYNALATVYWTAPNNNGGAIIKYTVVSFPDNRMVITPGETITNIYGLKNGVSYRFGVTATNKYGVSDISFLSLPVTPIKRISPSQPSRIGSRPDPPFNVVAIPYNASATVYWSEPNNNGGAIVKYTIFSIPDNKMVITPGETITNIFGLTNGVSYQFGVTATNKYGVSDMSIFSLPVIPIKKFLPLPPRNQIALTRPESTLLSWNSPSLNGGEKVIKYTITLLGTGEKFIYHVFESNPDILYEYKYLWKNLVNNSEYFFSISCSTSLGKSIDVFFNSIVPSPVPYPPTNVYISTHFKDLTSATVYWTPPVLNPNATPITHYAIVTEPALSNTPLIVGPRNTSWVITGLDSTKAYYFYVYAINDAGNSEYSNRAGPNQILTNMIKIDYKPLVTGGNDPSITKRMRYAYSIGRLRKSQYVNYGGGASFYT